MTILKVKPSQISDASAIAYRDKIMGVTYNIDLKTVYEPAVGAVPTLLAESGNLNGTYSYYVTFYTLTGETARSNMTGEITVTNQKITLSSIAISTDPKVIGRKIYRNLNGQDSVVKRLVATIADNITTTYVDNIADGSLGALVPQMNNIGGQILLTGSRIFATQGSSLALGSSCMPNMTGYANTAVGINCMSRNTSGYRSVAFGMFALDQNTTGYNNSAFGVHALNNNVTGTNNCSFGYMNSQSCNGTDNSAFGTAAFTLNAAGSYNCAFGVNSLHNNLGSSNTAIGYYSLLDNSTGSGNVAIGAGAGRYETGSNKLFIDNAVRASEADARLKAMIYGIFASAPADQLITFNAVMRLTPQSSAPTSNLAEGNIYSNSTDKHLYYYNGTTWKQLDN